MVDPVQRQQHCDKQRMAQRVPVQAHARDKDEREHIISRHAEVVVEHRPEPDVGTTCKRVVVVVYQHCVEQDKHHECYERYRALLLA